jgi:hypothetical protein
MGIMRPQNDKMKPIIMAVGGAIIAAVGTMFVPTSLLESITGATGLSELVPATAAPLGDTARALIAFGTGAVTLILLLAFSLRQPDASRPKEYAAPTKIESYDQAEDSDDRFSGLKERMAQIRLPQIDLPKMPWTRGEDDILDLADLPKLRSNDAHPDAPPRRPISVLNDIEDTNAAASQEPLTQPSSLFEKAVTEVTNLSPDLSEPEYAQPVYSEPAYEEAPAASVFQSAAPAYEAPMANHAASPQPSLAEMVAQMEAAVEQRKQQLEALEVVAAEMTADKGVVAPAFVAPVASSIPNPLPVNDAYSAERPPLEAVPSARRAEEEDDMDAALNAALETLQRMNRSGS